MHATRSGRLTRALAATPLRYRDFRVLWGATLCTGTAFAGETIVLGWLLLERTDSPFIVAFGVALRSLPNLLLGVLGGAVADRFDRRAVLQIISLQQALYTGILALLAVLGALEVWQILLFTFLGGCSRALRQSAQQSYAFDIVGLNEVTRGTAFMNLGQRAGGIAGSLVAGVALAHWGAGGGYGLLSVAHLMGTFVLLLAQSKGQAAPKTQPSLRQGLGEYVTELRTNRSLATIVLLTAAVEVLGFSHQAVLPSLARDLLDVGAEGLGAISAVAMAGGLIAVLLVGVQGEIRRKGLVFLLVLHCFGAAIVVLGLSGSITMAIVAIALVNAMAALTDLLSQSLVQAAVPNELRGRAMGSWVLAIGLGPVGHLQIGAVAATAGVAVALVTNGALLVGLAAVTLVMARGLRRL